MIQLFNNLWEILHHLFQKFLLILLIPTSSCIYWFTAENKYSDYSMKYVIWVTGLFLAQRTSSFMYFLVDYFFALNCQFFLGYCWKINKQYSSKWRNCWISFSSSEVMTRMFSKLLFGFLYSLDFGTSVWMICCKILFWFGVLNSIYWREWIRHQAKL